MRAGPLKVAELKTGMRTAQKGNDHPDFGVSTPPSTGVRVTRSDSILVPDRMTGPRYHDYAVPGVDGRKPHHA